MQKKVDKDNEYLWRVTTIPAEIDFFLEQNQLHFRQSKYESTPLPTKKMKQKFDWNISTEEEGEVLKGTYNNKEDEELTEIMKLILTNCIQIAPSKKTNSEITVAQLRRKMKVWRELTTTSPS